MVTVNTNIIGTGGDFATEEGWRSARAGNFVTDDRREVGKMLNEAFAEDASISGATTDATHYWELRADVANRHNGKKNSGARIVGQTNTTTLLISDEHARVIGLEIQPPDGTSARGIAINAVSGGGDQRIISCLVIGSDAGSGTSRGIFCVDSSINAVIANNMVHNITRTAGVGIDIANSATVDLYNNTVFNCTVNIERSAGTVTAKNNGSYDSITASSDYVGTFDGASTDNTSSDSTAPGSDPTTSAVSGDDFANNSTTAADTDLRLKAASSLIDTGVDLSADAGFAFSVDIFEMSRPQDSDWDRGAHEFVPPTPPVPAALGAGRLMILDILD